MSGGVVQAKVSDDAYMTVRNDPGTIGQVAVQFTAKAPTFAPASVTFTLEANATASGLIQVIQLFDWVAGAWVQVDARPATPTDQVVNVPLTDAARFVDARSRNMTALVRFNASGPDAGMWAGRIDRVAWTVR
jgi:hypothetical protein